MRGQDRLEWPRYLFFYRRPALVRRAMTDIEDAEGSEESDSAGRVCHERGF